MICSAKPVLREDLYIAQTEDFSVTCYMCDTTLDKDEAKYFHKRQTHLLVRGDVTLGLLLQGLS
jgi:hypothetical protein